MVSVEVGVPLITIAAIDLGAPASVYPYDGGTRLFWRWGWPVSIALLLVHFIALWSASKWDTLCAQAPHWMEW
jgi:hypothetical protein